MNTELHNTETIAKLLSEKAKVVNKIIKLDGITIECTVASSDLVNKGLLEMNRLCKKYNLLPISTEQNKDKQNIFIVQFPDLNVQYTDEEKHKLYYYILNNNITNFIANCKNLNKPISIQDVIYSKGSFIRQAIRLYSRTSTNIYRTNLQSLLSDSEYIHYVSQIFDEVVSSLSK